MVRKGFVSSLQRDADAFAVERAKLDLDVANTRKKVLVEFTKAKTLKENYRFLSTQIDDLMQTLIGGDAD